MKLMASKSVYVLFNKDINITKIGISDSVKARKSALEFACGCLLELVHMTEPLKEAPLYERLLHERFKDERRVGEWFNISKEEAVLAVKEVVNNAEVDPIVFKYKSGMSITQIAEIYNVSRQAIIHKLKCYGYHTNNVDIKPIETIEVSPISLPKLKEIPLSIEGEPLPSKLSGFKRLESNINFNGEWYQISKYKEGAFINAYTKEITKAREYAQVL